MAPKHLFTTVRFKELTNEHLQDVVQFYNNFRKDHEDAAIHITFEQKSTVREHMGARPHLGPAQPRRTGRWHERRVGRRDRRSAGAQLGRECAGSDP